MTRGTKGKSDQTTLADLLPIFKSGSFAVSVNGVPALSIDAKSRSLNLEAKGVKKTGLKLLNVIKEKREGFIGTLKTSESIAKKLAESGWRVTVYDGNKEVLTMGCGVSRFTGYIHVNPLKLRTVLEVV